MSAPLPTRSAPPGGPRLGAGLLSGLGLLAPAAHAQSAPDTTTGAWPAPLQQALRQSGVPAEAVSLLVWPVDAPQPRWQHQADAPRQAASVMKLFTTGVAHRGRPGWPAANQRRARWAAVPARWRRPLAADRTRAAHDGSLARRGPARHPPPHRPRPRPVPAARPPPARLPPP